MSRRMGQLVVTHDAKRFNSIDFSMWNTHKKATSAV